ncbi:retrovirus-related pol polyprotein from transposon TNT 1-94, partial [Tanacetum coccineum]
MSSNPINQATIQDGRVTIQQVQGRQNQSFAGTRNKGIATNLRGNYEAGQEKAVKCYNCLGEGHMAKQCTQPKRSRISAWFKEKLMLDEAQEAGQILDEEQLAFIEDPRIEKVQVAQQTIPQNLAFQTEDLEVYDLDYDDISSAKVVLMVNLLSCDSDVLSEESQHAGIQDIHSSTPNDLLVLSLVEQMTDHEHDVISVIDDEETLILEEEGRSKMLDKQNDPFSIKQKIKISPIDYSKLNKLKDFGKRFVTQKELSAEQAFWLKHSNYNPDTSVKSHTPVRIEAPSQIPK